MGDMVGLLSDQIDNQDLVSDHFNQFSFYLNRGVKSLILSLTSFSFLFFYQELFSNNLCCAYRYSVENVM